MEHVELWLKFLVASGIVVVAGISLTRNTEMLAEAMGWGHAFAGFVVLGWATSLPEVTISLSAVQAVGSAGLAAGNITGSIIFNLGILGLLDLLAQRRRADRDTRAQGVTPLAVFNLLMLGGMLLLALEPDLARGRLSIAGGVYLLLMYALSTLHAWRTQRGLDTPRGSDLRSSYRMAIALRCMASGLVILIAGVWLSHIGDDMSASYGLEEGLVGTLFLAAVSSLPELVTGLAAVRMGLLTLASASILGSNIFNLAILGVCDLTYQSSVEPLPILTAADDPRMGRNLIGGILMTVLALATVRMRAGGAGRSLLSPLPAAMIVIYFVTLFLP